MTVIQHGLPQHCYAKDTVIVPVYVFYHHWLAGTPLGDPIELGAAAAVFLHPKTPSRPTPMTHISLMAAKSWVGHSEPAAGLIGLAQAHLALHHHMQMPILHLGHMNRHVASALQHGTASGQFQIMRQQASVSGVDSGSSKLRCGVSAFAFQGTNAHAIIEQAGPQPGQAVEAGRPALEWHTQRHWIAPIAQALLTGMQAFLVMENSTHFLVSTEPCALFKYCFETSNKHSPAHVLIVPFGVSVATDGQSFL